MTIWDFANNHPLAVIVLAFIATAPLHYGYMAYRQYLRAKNIALHGWPKPPLDADGEIVYPEDDDADGPKPSGNNGNISNHGKTDV